MQTMTKVVSVTLLALLAVGACASDEPVRPAGDLVPAGGSSAAASGTGGSGGMAAQNGGSSGNRAQPEGCPAGRGPEMVEIALPGKPAFCIDTTEVTQGQYAAFLADKAADPNSQSRELCRTHNVSFQPALKQAEGLDGCAPSVYAPEKKADVPMSCVDFCDAVAFCEWSGRRLCGSVNGGPLSTEEPADSENSQWYLACSQGGKTKFPYGEAFEPGRCDADGKGYTALPAAESACAGTTAPFDRIKNLSGNVSEWEDWMNIGGALRGNDGRSKELDYFACGTRMEAAAWGSGSGNEGRGFRCCADLPKP